VIETVALNKKQQWARTMARERLAGMLDTREALDYVHVAARAGERTLDGEVIAERDAGRACARCGEPLAMRTQPAWMPGEHVAILPGDPGGGWRTYRSPSCKPISKRLRVVAPALATGARA
jgi:hypothetical protein